MDSPTGVTETLEGDTAAHNGHVPSVGTAAPPRTDRRGQPHRTQDIHAVPLHEPDRLRATGLQAWYPAALAAVVVVGFLVLTVLVTTAMSGESAKPSGKVTMESKSIAVGVGVTWGDGKLNFKGKDYPFSIDGMTVVDFGISKASANGDVYNLTDVAKFAGTYVAAEAGFALAGGMGGMVLRNQDGVVLHVRSTSQGAKLQLGPSGLSIKMK